MPVRTGPCLQTERWLSNAWIICLMRWTDRDCPRHLLGPAGQRFLHSLHATLLPSTRNGVTNGRPSDRTMHTEAQTQGLRGGGLKHLLRGSLPKLDRGLMEPRCECGTVSLLPPREWSSKQSVQPIRGL